MDRVLSTSTELDEKQPSSDRLEDVTAAPLESEPSSTGVCAAVRHVSFTDVPPSEKSTTHGKRRKAAVVAPPQPEGIEPASEPAAEPSIPAKFFSHSLGPVPDRTVSGQPYYLSVFETRESSISFKECKNVCNGFINFCHSLNTKRMRQRSGDEQVSDSNPDVLESFSSNSALQDLFDYQLSEWGSGRAWDERKTAVRQMASVASQRATSVAAAHLTHPGVKTVGTFTRLSLNGSYGSVQEGLFIHVWNSCSQARRMALAFRRISQALFDGYVSSTVAAPIAFLFSFRGSAVMVLPCVPLADIAPTVVAPSQTPTLSHFASMLAAALGSSVGQKAGDMKLYRGSDGRFYCIDVETPLPNCFSAPAGDGANYARLEAYSMMPDKHSVPQHLRHDELVKASIVNMLVPLAAQTLLSEVAARKLTADAAIRGGVCADVLHKVGVNMRFLYFVLTSEALVLPPPGDDDGGSESDAQFRQCARDILAAEMAIRTVKDVIRAELCTIKGENQEAAVERVNRVLASCLASKKSGVWEAHIMPALRLKFAAPEGFVTPLSPSLLKQIAARLTQRLGFVYKPEEQRFTGFSGKTISCSLFQVPAVARFIIYGDDKSEAADPALLEVDMKRMQSMRTLSRRRSSGSLLVSAQAQTQAPEFPSDFGEVVSPSPSMVAEPDISSLSRTKSFFSRRDVALKMIEIEDGVSGQREDGDDGDAIGDTIGSSNFTGASALAQRGLHTLIYSLNKRIVIATVIQDSSMAHDACNELFLLLQNTHPVQKVREAAAPAAVSSPAAQPTLKIVRESITFAGASAILYDVQPLGRQLIGHEHHNVLRSVVRQAIDNWYVAERIRNLGQAMNDPGTMIDSFRYGRKAYWVDATLRPKYFWFLLEATKSLNVSDCAQELKELLLLAAKYCANNAEMRKTLVLQCRKITSALVASQDLEGCQQLKDVSLQSLVMHEKVFGSAAAQTGVAIVHMVDVTLHAHLSTLSRTNARELKKFHNIAVTLGTKTEEELLEFLKSDSFLALLGTMVGALMQEGERGAAQHAMHYALAFSGGRELQQSVAVSQAELQTRAISLILRWVHRRRKKTEWTAERLQETEASHRRGLEVLWSDATRAMWLRTCELFEDSKRLELIKLERIVRRRMYEAVWRDRYEVRRLGRMQEKHVENVLRSENRMRVAREAAARREVELAIRRQEQERLDVEAQIADVTRELGRRTRHPQPGLHQPGDRAGEATSLKKARPSKPRARLPRSPLPSDPAAEEQRRRDLMDRVAAVELRKEFLSEQRAMLRGEEAQRRGLGELQRREWFALLSAAATASSHLGAHEVQVALEKRKSEAAQAREREARELAQHRERRRETRKAAKEQATLARIEAGLRCQTVGEERLARHAIVLTANELGRLLAREHITHKLEKRGRYRNAQHGSAEGLRGESEEDRYARRFEALSKHEERCRRGAAAAEEHRIAALLRLHIHRRRRIELHEAHEAKAQRSGSATLPDRVRHDRVQLQRLKRALGPLLAQERQSRSTIERHAFQAHPTRVIRGRNSSGGLHSVFDATAATQRAIRDVEVQERTGRRKVEGSESFSWGRLCTLLGATGGVSASPLQKRTLPATWREREAQRECAVALAVERARRDYLALKAQDRDVDDDDEDGESGEEHCPAPVLQHEAEERGAQLQGQTTQRVLRMMRMKQAEAETVREWFSSSSTQRSRPEGDQALQLLQAHRWLLYKARIVSKAETKARLAVQSHEEHQRFVLMATMRRELDNVGSTAEARKRVREERAKRERWREEQDEIRVRQMLERAQRELEEEKSRASPHRVEESPVKVVSGCDNEDDAVGLLQRPSPQLRMFFYKQMLARRVREELLVSQQMRQDAITQSSQASHVHDQHMSPSTKLRESNACEQLKQERALAVRAQRVAIKQALEERRTADAEEAVRRREEHMSRRTRQADTVDGIDRAVVDARAELEEIRRELGARRQEEQGANGSRKSPGIAMTVSPEAAAKGRLRAEWLLARSRSLRCEGNATASVPKAASPHATTTHSRTPPPHQSAAKVSPGLLPPLQNTPIVKAKSRKLAREQWKHDRSVDQDAFQESKATAAQELARRNERVRRMREERQRAKKAVEQLEAERQRARIEAAEAELREARQRCSSTSPVE